MPPNLPEMCTSRRFTCPPSLVYSEALAVQPATYPVADCPGNDPPYLGGKRVAFLFAETQAMQSNGKIFCLVDAPDADAANTVHREAHGLVADEIYSVTEGA